MLDLQKARMEKELAERLLQKLGQAPDCLYTDGHADMLVPRDNIEGSGKAVLWLNGIIEDLEKQEQFKGTELIDSLKGLYLVFRDCSLMAKHYLGFREAQMPANLRGCDLIYRFSLDPKNNEYIFMDIGSAVLKKPETEAPDDELND